MADISASIGDRIEFEYALGGGGAIFQGVVTGLDGDESLLKVQTVNTGATMSVQISQVVYNATTGQRQTGYKSVYEQKVDPLYGRKYRVL